MGKRIMLFLSAFLLLLILLVLAYGCSAGKEEQKTEKIIPVSVYRVSEQEKQYYSRYTGTVQPEKTVKLSFKTGGRVEYIAVKKGDSVKKGDVLASLEKTDLLYAESLAKSQLEIALAQYEKAAGGATEEEIEQARLNVMKASEAYNYAKERFREAEELYQDGTVTKQVYEQALLEVRIRDADLRLANEVLSQVQKGAREEDLKVLAAQVNTAETEYSYRRNQLSEAVLRAPADGTVLDVLCEEGEITGAGYPVIVLRTGEKIVYVGVTEEELKNISEDTEVTVEKDGKVFEARIKSVSELPDPMTGLYNIEIACDKLDLPLGAVVAVNFSMGNRRGFYIPISAVLNDGSDYVFVVSDDRVQRRSITIEEAFNFDVRVTGINEGDLVLIAGMGRVSPGDRVVVKEVDYGTDN